MLTSCLCAAVLENEELFEAAYAEFEVVAQSSHVMSGSAGEGKTCYWVQFPGAHQEPMSPVASQLRALAEKHAEDTPLRRWCQIIGREEPHPAYGPWEEGVDPKYFHTAGDGKDPPCSCSLWSEFKRLVLGDRSGAVACYALGLGLGIQDLCTFFHFFFNYHPTMTH